MRGQLKAEENINKNAKNTKPRPSNSKQTLISGHYIEALDEKFVLIISINCVLLSWKILLPVYIIFWTSKNSFIV